MQSKKRAFFFSIFFVFLLCFTVSVSAQWKTINGKQKYYVKETNSYVKSAWYRIDSKWYYFDKNGVMATNCCIGDSYVGDSGTIVKGKKNPKKLPSKDEIRLLAAITYLEAGNQSYYGKQCVASVVVNRVKSSRFPDTLKGVIYQSGQFSPTWNGSLNRVLAKGPSSTAYSVAQAAMGGARHSAVINCYSFRAAWTGVAGVNVGGNIFF